MKNNHMKNKYIKNELELIAGSYDNTIELGRKGINMYQNLPDFITRHSDYPLYVKAEKEDRAQEAIKEYLSPQPGMRFIDLGCCLNFMFRGYADWPSLYYGVDISEKTIELLREFTVKQKLTAGGFYWGSMHDTPYADNFFDIGACIGSLEYFEKEFVKEALAQAWRIMKPGGKFVLDIPDANSPACRIAMLIEEYLGRPDKFNMTVKEFEEMLQCYFLIERADTGTMRQYYLRCRKPR